MDTALSAPSGPGRPHRRTAAAWRRACIGGAGPSRSTPSSAQGRRLPHRATGSFHRPGRPAAGVRPCCPPSGRSVRVAARDGAAASACEERFESGRALTLICQLRGVHGRTGTASEVDTAPDGRGIRSGQALSGGGARAPCGGLAVVRSARRRPAARQHSSGLQEGVAGAAAAGGVQPAPPGTGHQALRPFRPGRRGRPAHAGCGRGGPSPARRRGCRPAGRRPGQAAPAARPPAPRPARRRPRRAGGGRGSSRRPAWVEVLPEGVGAKLAHQACASRGRGGAPGYPAVWLLHRVLAEARVIEILARQVAP